MSRLFATPCRIAFALVSIVAWRAGNAQEPARAQAPCDCRADLDTLGAKLERNYIAWHLEVVRTPREAEYRQLLQRLQARAAGADDAACLFLLRELTDWFNDGHLFVFELPPVAPELAARLAAATESRPVSESAVRADLLRRARTRDPIEGIWFARGYRVAIVPAVANSTREFVAVVLSSDSALWKPGQVKATFTRLPDGAYRTVLKADDHSKRHMNARIFRNLLLVTTPMTWGREFPLAPHEERTLDPVDPTRPTLRLVGDDAVVVSVPSHDPQYRSALDTLVARHRSDLSTRPYLVIDIRGDIGGGSMTTAPLVPFLVSRTQRDPTGPQGNSTVVSSPDNIRYFQRGWNPDSILERMAAAPGAVMPLMRNETLGMPFPNDSVLGAPHRVGVLMDRGVASAGEAFVLQARRSTKVTLFGENTWGMIDYQSVMVVRLACRERGILFGYAMIAASATLPKDGLNAEGIPPDVRIGRDVADPIREVILQLRKGAAVPPPK
jgi:hypothetical protein